MNNDMAAHFYRKEMRHRFRRWMAIPTAFMMLAYGSAIISRPEAPVSGAIFWLWLAWWAFCAYKFSGQAPKE